MDRSIDLAVQHTKFSRQGSSFQFFINCPAIYNVYELLSPRCSRYSSYCPFSCLLHQFYVLQLAVFAMYMNCMLTTQPGRENQGATPITLEPVKETSRIKKHVSSVVDRWPNATRVRTGRAMVVVAGSQRVGSWTTSTWPPIPPRSSTLSPERTPSMRVRLTSQREWREWRWSAGLWRWQAPRWAPGQLSNLTWPLSWAPGRPVGDFSKFQISGLGSLAREFGAQEWGLPDLPGNTIWSQPLWVHSSPSEKQKKQPTLPQLFQVETCVSFKQPRRRDGRCSPWWPRWYWRAWGEPSGEEETMVSRRKNIDFDYLEMSVYWNVHHNTVFVHHILVLFNLWPISSNLNLRDLVHLCSCPSQDDLPPLPPPPTRAPKLGDIKWRSLSS